MALKKKINKSKKSKCVVISRDGDVIIAKMLINKKAKLSFKVGGSVRNDENNSIKGIILELSVKLVKILLLGMSKNISNKSFLYPCKKVLSVNKSIPGMVYNGIGEKICDFKPRLEEL